MPVGCRRWFGQAVGRGCFVSSALFDCLSNGFNAVHGQTGSRAVCSLDENPLRAGCDRLAGHGRARPERERIIGTVRQFCGQEVSHLHGFLAGTLKLLDQVAGWLRRPPRRVPVTLDAPYLNGIGPSRTTAPVTEPHRVPGAKCTVCHLSGPDPGNRPEIFGARLIFSA